MRIKYIPRVLSLVRFLMIPAVFILQWTSNLKDLRPELANVLCHFLHNAMLSQFEYYTETFQSESIIRGNRRWAQDPQCPYLSLFNANGDSDLSPDVFFRYLRQIQNSPKSFVARLIMKDHMEYEIGDALTVNESWTSENSAEDLKEPGEYNCAVGGTSSTEDLDAAPNVKQTFYTSAVELDLDLLAKNHSVFDSDLDSSESSSTTTSIDSFTDCKNGSGTEVNFHAEHPANSNASSFSDSTTCSGGDSETESVQDSNVACTPNLTPESPTEPATNSAEYSGTVSSTYSQTDGISSEVYET